jgi:hypothetical protein
MNDREQKRLDGLIASRAHRFPEGAAPLAAIDRELDSIDAEPLGEAEIARIVNRAAIFRAWKERPVVKPCGQIPRPRVGLVTLPAEDHASPVGPITPPAARPRTSQGGTSQEDQDDYGTGTGLASGLA